MAEAFQSFILEASALIKTFLVLLASLSAILWPYSSHAQPVTTQVTLAGLPVDSSLASFTDLGSGAVFTNPLTPAGHIFIVDFWNSSATLSDLTPGRVISSNGFVPGGGLSLPYDFSFTMTLPTLVRDVEAIMAYSTDFSNTPAGTMLMEGFDDTGNKVAATSVQPAVGNFLEQPLSLSSGTYNIRKVTFTPTNLFDAFGSISFTTVPEPSTIALLALGCLS